MERRLTAILAADVAGYSRLMGQDEAATLKALKRHQSDLIVPKAAQYGGRIIKLMGDGVLMEFESVVAAVAFAVEVQSAMRDRNEGVPEERQIVYRIGINIGDVLIEGDDIYGDGVNIAARLEGLAEPGGICIARSVYNQVRDKLDLNVQDLGEVSVKNIVRPVHAFQIAMDEKAAALCTPIVEGAAKRIRSSRTFVMAALAFLLVAVGTGVWIHYADVGVRSERDSRPSIAVLPFASRSGDTARDYFADGLTQDVINALGRFSGLTVMSWNAVAQYKGDVVPPREVGRTLAVLYQVEGSIQQTSDRLRLTAQLVSSNGRVLWSARFDEALTELFVLQDKLTTQIAGALAVGVEEIEQRQARAKPTQSLEAYDYVLRARPALRNPNRAAIVQGTRFPEARH